MLLFAPPFSRSCSRCPSKGGSRGGVPRGPLTRLTAAAMALARGTRAHRGRAGRPEEVRALAVSFNHMSGEIHAQTAGPRGEPEARREGSPTTSRDPGIRRARAGRAPSRAH
ncbi:MAG: HAMP domain-containing protein [Holophagales bacterium]|nr:HAMP domain-containing protein [Holophagales bacterium]